MSPIGYIRHVLVAAALSADVSESVTEAGRSIGATDYEQCKVDDGPDGLPRVTPTVVADVVDLDVSDVPAGTIDVGGTSAESVDLSQANALLDGFPTQRDRVLRAFACMRHLFPGDDVRIIEVAGPDEPSYLAIEVSTAVDPDVADERLDEAIRAWLEDRAGTPGPSVTLSVEYA